MIYDKLTKLAVGFSAITLSAMVSSSASAAGVVNGSFETTTNGPGQIGFNTDLPGWTYATAPNSFDFIFAPGTADTTGSPGQYGNLTLWGSNNGGTSVFSTSPDGGNFLGVDGAFQNTAPISQTLTGLNVGQTYQVSFYDAAAQQTGYTGATQEQWQVSFGGVTQNATLFNLASQAFSGWKQESLTFTANAPTQVLQFFATGSPGGEPPFALLDGVSVQAVPEPSSLFGLGALVLLGLGSRFQLKLAEKK
jgi:hypothetical protein